MGEGQATHSKSKEIMKIKKETLLFDIANLAYIIADTGDTGESHNHGLHRVRDICEAGNRDRVARVLGLAYSKILEVTAAVTEPSEISVNHDFSATLHDYEIRFTKEGRINLTSQKKLRVKELSREYMVAAVMADWLELTLPEAAHAMELKAEAALSALESLVASAISVAGRRISPM